MQSSFFLLFANDSYAAAIIVIVTENLKIIFK